MLELPKVAIVVSTQCLNEEAVAYQFLLVLIVDLF